jgi:hypothetical protein
MRIQERISFMREIDKCKGIREEPIMFNSINQQPPMMNKGGKKRRNGHGINKLKKQ